MGPSYRWIVAAILTSGCYTSHIDGPATVLDPRTSLTDAVVLDVIDPDPERMPNAEDATFAEMRRELPGLLEQGGLATRVIQQEDSGGLPEAERRLLVRYRPVDYANSVDSNGGRLALIMACGFLILPCPFIGLVPAAHQSIRTTWEARVYDISGIEPSRLALAGSREIAIVWDTTTLSPIMRESYELTLSASLGAMSHDEQERFERMVGRELATQLVAASAEDIARAMRQAVWAARVAAEPAEQAAPPPVGTD